MARFKVKRTRLPGGIVKKSQADSVVEFVREEARKNVLETYERVSKRYSEEAPRNTGNLADNFNIIDIDGDTITLSSEVEYMPAVEFGTERQAAQPNAERIFREELVGFDKDFRKELKKI